MNSRIIIVVVVRMVLKVISVILYEVVVVVLVLVVEDVDLRDKVVVQSSFICKLEFFLYSCCSNISRRGCSGDFNIICSCA